VIKLKAKINCGVIGLGRLGYRHATSIVKCQYANLIAVADPIEESLNRALKDFDSIKVYEDYRELLKNNDIDAVVIATLYWPPFIWT
jgi:predicted dehydrogenase